jgi:hypothetical protein
VLPCACLPYLDALSAIDVPQIRRPEILIDAKLLLFSAAPLAVSKVDRLARF